LDPATSYSYNPTPIPSPHLPTPFTSPTTFIKLAGEKREKRERKEREKREKRERKEREKREKRERKERECL
jgi:hypothetical protein